MTEHPILFSAPMILAILDGRKTMTRRIVKPQPRRALAPISISAWEPGVTAFKPGDFGVYREGTPIGRWGLESVIKGRYKKGDLLWAKETWAIVKDDDDRDKRIYKADGVIGSAAYRGVDFGARTYYGPWKSSIFMPRRESRITLEVTADERIERLQEITEWDAYNEGFNEIGEFHAFWDSLNAKSGHGWDVNDYVRVIALKRIKP